MKTLERLLAKTVRSGDCLLFTGCINKNGYGSFRFNGKTANVHKVSYILHHGDIPDGLVVMHSCDNRNCVEPTHLTLGTQSDNLRDMARKGRSGSKLSNEDVAAIRQDDRDSFTIGRAYDVHPTTIQKIKRGINRRFS